MVGMTDIVDKFHDQVPKHLQSYVGNVDEIGEDHVSFEGDTVEAAHEAWMFKTFINEQTGYESAYGTKEFGTTDSTKVVLIDVPDVPDWVQLNVVDEDTVALKAFGEVVSADINQVMDGVNELQDQVWKPISRINGVGSTTLQRLVNELDSPLDVDDWTQVEGVGNAVASRIETVVEERK